eukprot:9072595-Karenia_brevis.AAC.1
MRLVINRTQNGNCTLGCVFFLRYRGFLEKSGISGMPVQNLNMKENATPKYHGSNWSMTTLPVLIT